MVNIAGWVTLGIGAFILLKGFNDLNNREFAVGVVELGVGILMGGIGVVTLVAEGI